MWHLGMELFFSKILQCSPGEHDVHHVNTCFELWLSSSTWERNFFRGMFQTKLKVKYAVECTNSQFHFQLHFFHL